MNKVLLLALLLFCAVANLLALKAEENGSIYGKVVSFNSKKSLEYVTIAIYSANDDKLIGGAITKIDGTFKLKGITAGVYYLDVSFVGYQTKRIEDIIIEKSTHQLNIGQITLGSNDTKIGEIEIVAEQTPLEFKLDKKVVNVRKHFASISGTAVNILENVPSVTVDIEGNVELRGSSGFSVLVDGVPSLLEPSEALQQIPASTIESIEIITNPSVKYNPDGKAGIINVITKKKGLNGISGVTNLKIGTNNLGGDFLFNTRGKKLSWFLGADYNHSDYSGDKNGYRYAYRNDTVYTVKHFGSIGLKYDKYNFKSGAELRFDSLKSLSLDLTFGNRDNYSLSDLNYEKFDNINTSPYRYISNEDGFRGNIGFAANVAYHHRFNKEGHEFKTLLSYIKRDAKESNKNILYGQDGQVTEGRENTEEGPVSRLEVKLDYTKPTGEQGKIETGYQSTFSRIKDATGLKEDLAGSGSFVENSLYTKEVGFTQDIHALYFIYGNQFSKLGYQLGLRGEYNIREVFLVNGGENGIIGDAEVTVNRFDYFPSAHFSYKLPLDQELMASYSRRIERSRSYHFEPFYTWVDAFNIRHGNSKLLPEFIDSYELNYLKKMKKSFLSFETYYLITNNKIEWVRSIYESNIIQRFPENVGKDYSLGIDATYSFNMLKWWRIDLSGSLYNYQVKGKWGDITYDEEKLTWNYRVNQTIKLSKLAQLQANWRYYSKRITTQGIYQPVYTLDIAFKKEMMKRKLTGVFEIRDVFATNNRENTNEGIGFKDHYYQMIHTPVLTFTFTYRFNNYKPLGRRRGDDGFGGTESME